jgi:excisionase family DNA binding protein
MANYVTLDDAAKILGISADELVEMRSRGEIFGYRDGSSWKFKSEEIERVQSELGGDAMDEDAGGSSILISERQVGPSGSKSGSTIGKAGGSDLSLDSELKLGDGSDVKLVPDPKSDSGVRLVNKAARKPSQGSSLDLEEGPLSGISSGISGVSDLQLQIEGGSGSEVELGSDLNLIADSADSGVDLLGKDSGASALNLGSGSRSGLGGRSGSIGLGNDLELASDDEDDLVLGSDSGVGLGSESGINLMSPSDSGISLEDEPLDLAGTGISGLDLGAEVGSGSGSGATPGGGSGAGLSGLGSGALIDFEQAEEFQLTPSGGIDVDDDSGSQVIELEDSSEFGSIPAGAGGFEPIQEGGFSDGGFGNEEAEVMGGAMVAGAAMRGIPETPYATWEVLLLLGIIMLMGFGGLFTADLMRNMWAWDGQNDYTSALTRLFIGGK